MKTVILLIVTYLKFSEEVSKERNKFFVALKFKRQVAFYYQLKSKKLLVVIITLKHQQSHFSFLQHQFISDDAF